MEIKNLYDDEVYHSMVERINNLDADTKPDWGEMSAGQMMAHCAEIQEVLNGTKTLDHTPFFIKLIKGFIRKMVVNDVPYRHSLQTHPQYKQTEERDFETEKARFLSSLEFFKEHEHDAVHPAHPLFGYMSHHERGWSMYKHHDHHLTQFGV